MTTVFCILQFGHSGMQARFGWTIFFKSHCTAWCLWFGSLQLLAGLSWVVVECCSLSPAKVIQYHFYMLPGNIWHWATKFFTLFSVFRVMTSDDCAICFPPPLPYVCTAANGNILIQPSPRLKPKGKWIWSLLQQHSTSKYQFCFIIYFCIKN